VAEWKGSWWTGSAAYQWCVLLGLGALMLAVQNNIMASGQSGCCCCSHGSLQTWLETQSARLWNTLSSNSQMCEFMCSCTIYINVRDLCARSVVSTHTLFPNNSLCLNDIYTVRFWLQCANRTFCFHASQPSIRTLKTLMVWVVHSFLCSISCIECLRIVAKCRDRSLSRAP